MKERPLRTGVVGAKIIVEVVEWDEATQKDVPVDISSATANGSKMIIIKRPDGTKIVANDAACSFVTDGTDGLMQYSTIATDLIHSDTHYVQGFVDTVNWAGHTDIGSFEVEGNL